LHQKMNVTSGDASDMHADAGASSSVENYRSNETNERPFSTNLMIRLSRTHRMKQKIAKTVNKCPDGIG